MFDSLQCAWLHEILQARILEWVAISYYWASSQPRDRTPISHIGRRILYHWATREAQWKDTGQICGTETAIRLMLHFNREETSSEQSFIVFFFFINTIIWKKKKKRYFLIFAYYSAKLFCIPWSLFNSQRTCPRSHSLSPGHSIRIWARKVEVLGTGGVTLKKISYSDSDMWPFSSWGSSEMQCTFSSYGFYYSDHLFTVKMP